MKIELDEDEIANLKEVLATIAHPDLKNIFKENQEKNIFSVLDSGTWIETLYKKLPDVETKPTRGYSEFHDLAEEKMCEITDEMRFPEYVKPAQNLGEIYQLLDDVKDEATGDAYNPGKRVWPIRSRTWRRIDAALKELSRWQVILDQQIYLSKTPEYVEQMQSGDRLVVLRPRDKKD